MKNLPDFLKEIGATFKPANRESVLDLEEILGFELSEHYKDFLHKVGFIDVGSIEVYGLGVPKNYYLNVYDAYSDLSGDESYPRSAVPLLDVGDGQYYLYDNASEKILLWATPNGGIVKTLDEELERFLVHWIRGHN